jgi:hypothetical protein
VILIAASSEARGLVFCNRLNILRLDKHDVVISIGGLGAVIEDMQLKRAELVNPFDTQHISGATLQKLLPFRRDRMIRIRWHSKYPDSVSDFKSARLKEVRERFRVRRSAAPHLRENIPPGASGAPSPITA